MHQDKVLACAVAVDDERQVVIWSHLKDYQHVLSKKVAGRQYGREATERMLS